MSLSDVFDEATRTIYGKNVRISVRVNASFRAGCFGADLTTSSSFIRHIIELFSGSPASVTCNIIVLVGFAVGYKAKSGLAQLITWINAGK
ncbi:TPA: hypothetical protein I8Y21_002278 [Klebsiella oxytoca]|uniref:Uncharacterized protein n=1 Tax=Klebsiella oxytoca TaxID=571 RepID=A0AAN5L778_KLEOX|nr:hypothetical protein [Klebsiella oxytoca]